WPSFWAELCAREATDIVVATEGTKIDGVLEVLETWRGDLARGETVDVPELSAFAADATRIVFSWAGRDGWAKVLDSGERDPREGTPVTGSRMVLFLKRIGDDPGQSKLICPSDKPRWAGCGWGGMDRSVVWVEGETVYAFVQIYKVANSALVPKGTEKALHE